MLVVLAVAVVILVVGAVLVYFLVLKDVSVA